MPAPYTDPFDTNTPTAVEGLSNGDDRIRELKRALNERLADALNNWPDGTASPKIANLSILTAMLADKAVTQPKIGDSAVGTLQLLDDAVTAAKIAALAVGTPELADLAVTTGKVANDAITDPKIAAGISGSKIGDLTLPGSKLVDRAISSGKIALLAIITELLDNAAVTEPKLADGAVTKTKVAADAISRGALEAPLRGELAITKYVDVVLASPVNVSLNAGKKLPAVALAGVAANDPVVCSLPEAFAGYPDGDQRLEFQVYAIATAGQITVVLNNTSTGSAMDFPAGTIRCSVTKTITDWGL